MKGLKSQAKGSECTVCLSDFGDEKTVRLLPKCNHAVHPEFIDTTPMAIVKPLTPPGQVTIVIDNRNNEAPETSHDSTGHSLVMVRKEMEQPTEWYIATPCGLTPELYRSCSFVASHHSRAPSTSN